MVSIPPSDPETPTISFRGEPTPLLGKEDFQAPAEPAPAQPALELMCPRCQEKLLNPASIGWCPKCGYCRSIAEEKINLSENSDGPARKASPLGALEFYQVLKKLPRWLYVLAGGSAAICVFSGLMGLALGSFPLTRAIWSTSRSCSA